jgi:hypothetical protein
MLAALATIWILFSVWLLSPHVGIAPRAARLIAYTLVAEFALLLLWSYGTDRCLERTCAPVAQAAGVAARIDLPVLALVIVAAAVRTATAPHRGGPAGVGKKQ